MKKLLCLVAFTFVVVGCTGTDTGTADKTLPPVETSNCEAHSDCSEGYLCQGGECRPGECVPEVQLECNTADTPEDIAPYCCKVWQVCNALNECVARPDSPVGSQCAVDEDCPGLGQFCSGGNCFETSGRDACTASFQCPTGERCDRTVYLCVPDAGGCTFADQFPELACEADQLCDVETGFCLDPGGQECTAASAATDCRPNEVCDQLGRCVQCITDDDCGPGTACNVGTGNCYSILNRCDSDADCSNGRRCSPATSECVAPQCEDDGDCDDNRKVCDLTTFTCFLPPASCDEDDEPNDSPATATPIELTGYAGTLCRGNTDYLSFPVEPGKRYRATVRFPDFNAGGIVVDIRNTSGLPEDTATFGTSATSVTVTGTSNPDETGNFTLRISGSGIEEDFWSYTVDIEVSEAPLEVSCADETANGIEPNNTFAQAYEIPLNQRVSFARCGTSDRDYYKVTVPELHGVEIEVEMVEEDGDLDIALYDTEGGSSIDTSSTSNDIERVDAPEGKRTFWLKVELWSGDTGAVTNQTYSIIARPVPRPATCDPDVNEPDTTIPQAGALDVDTSVSAIRCGAIDVDHFAVTVPPNRGGNLRIDFNHAQGDLRLDLLDLDGNVLESSNASTSTKGFEAVPLPFAAIEQTFYARVRLHSGSSGAAQPYTISASTFDASQCTASEPVTNDTFLSGTCVGTVTSDIACASTLTPPATWPDLATCAGESPPAGCGSICGFGDPDYYRAGKLNGQLLRAKLTHDVETGPLGIALVRLGPDGQTLTEVMVDNNTSSSDVLELSLVTPTLNELFVREYGIVVRPVGSADYSAQPYSLEVEIGPPCTPDAYEPNANPGGPARLRPNPTGPVDFSTTLSAARLCGGDVDVYEIFVFEGETLTATLSGIEGASVDIGTRVFGDPTEDAITVACGQGMPAGETATCPDGVNVPPTQYTSPMVATHEAEIGDYYYVTVRRQPNGAIGDYTLDIEVSAP